MYTFFKKNLIILFLGIFVIFSLSYLSWIEKKQHDLNLGKDWWVLYFNDPKGNSLDFTIENHSNTESFQWEVYLEKSKTYEGQSSLSKGERETIPVSASDLADKKVTIKVTAGEKIQEIYKIITNH